MAWSDAARAAAVDARRKRSGGAYVYVGNPLGGRDRVMTRLHAAAAMKSLRHRIRSGQSSALSDLQNTASLNNYRKAAKGSTLDLNGRVRRSTQESMEEHVRRYPSRMYERGYKPKYDRKRY